MVLASVTISCRVVVIILTRLFQQCHWNGYVHRSSCDACDLSVPFAVETRKLLAQHLNPVSGY